MAERDYDIVLFGATGFTGKMSVEYLAQNYSKMRIAIGGRDKGKLENIQRETKDKFGASFDVVVADSNNSEDLDRITKRTKVVASLVGPYLRYGTKLVESCVKNGSHYVDLTGESVWVKQIQEKYHEEAKRKNVKIVNFCGFDSIPSDMSVFLMNNLIKEKFGEKEELDSVTAVYSFNGPLAGSGGTIESMINILSLPFKTLKEMASPFYMCQNVKSGKSTKQTFLSYHKESEMWNSPFIMAAVNEQVVRKSNDLRDGNYGKNLNYGESMGAKSLKISLISFLLSIILPIFFLLMKVPILKDYLRKLVPKPSEGPTRQQMEKSRCNITYYGKTTSNKKVYANVQFNGDPAYLETSKMISEAAIVLANGEDKESALKGGILTPATALGNPLAERLNKANIKIKAYLNK